MSAELISVLIAVLAVGATLAGLMLSGQRAIRAELAAQRRDFNTEQAELRRELTAQRQEFGERFTALEQQIAALRAHLEGLLDGLREAIAVRQGAA